MFKFSIALSILMLMVLMSSCTSDTNISSTDLATYYFKPTATVGAESATETNVKSTPKPRPVATLSLCERAIMDAAKIPDSSDSFNDLDMAIRLCKSWKEFEAGVRKHPKAWTSMLGEPGYFSVLTGARMSCTDERLHNTPVCKKALEGVIFDQSRILSVFRRNTEVRKTVKFLLRK